MPTTITRPAVETVNGKTHATTAEELKPYHVTAHEAMCKDPADGTPCKFCGGRIYLSFAVLRRFRWVREAYGDKLGINSGTRCNDLQRYLWNHATAAERAKGLVAKPGFSPHEKGEALDVQKPARFKTQMAWGEFILKACRGDIRIGCRDYVGFAHIDVMFLLSAVFRRGIGW